MSGITGLGTTYNLPNYGGILYQLTPTDTPFFTAISMASAANQGFTPGGGQTTSTRFEWQTVDLRNAGQNVALEGAAAPTAQARARGNVDNVVEVHQEKVSVSYTKLAATGQKAGIANLEPNPVTDEAGFQVGLMLKQMGRDIEYAFLNGAYNLPTDNTTTRKTRGLLAAISTNVIAKATSTITGLSAATDTVTETSTALANGDKIVFTDIGASTTLVLGRTYFVVSKSTNAFKVATTSGGSAITIGTATVSYRKPWTTALDKATLDTLFQSVYDNGGLTEGSMATIMVNSSQKLALSAAYAAAYGKYVESSRTVAGVNFKTITTDFGELNVMLNRYLPQDAVVVTSLEQCLPVWLEVPNKGHLFAEPLAKTGASDDVQLYGEVGLAYGNEKAHGILTGLAV